MPTEKEIIMSGFKEDCEELLSRFEQADNIRFGTFCEIWKDMKFSLIFTGRPTYFELLTFCEEALHISKQFMLMPPRFKEKVAGLYLLYGVYYKMPVDDFKIHVTLQDWHTIVEFHKELKTGQHLDANYILSKLIKDNSFHFCLFDEEYILEKRLFEEKQQFNPFSAFPSLKDLTDKNQILTRMDELSKKYDRKKKNLIAKGASKSNLSMYKADTAEEIINDIRILEEDRRKQLSSECESEETDDLPSTSQEKSKKPLPKGFKRCITFRDTHKIDVDSDEDSENLE